MKNNLFIKISIIILMIIKNNSAFSHGSGGGNGYSYIEKDKPKSPVIIEVPNISVSQAIYFLEQGLDFMLSIIEDKKFENIKNDIDVMMKLNETNKIVHESIEALEYYINKMNEYDKKHTINEFDSFSQSIVEYKIYTSQKNAVKAKEEAYKARDALRLLSKKMGH